ncbi:M-protein, striated muscle-like [Littorina saxatilis]|uniref:M-protein, striated muscle-like n=1 Tax=Littorina saxatilis TaxID=31220 RepID=UPI0038B61BFE
MTSNTIQNLTTGSDYFFRVMAENKAGPSPPLEMDKPVRIKSPYDVPSAPTGLRVSNVTDKSADVSWTAPDSDGGTPITNYIVQTRIIPRSTFTTVQETTETKVTLTGLVADSQYMLQIIAVNAEGQSLPLQSREPICPEKILSVPDAPASLLIKNITKDGLTLEWTPPENDGGSRVRRYIIEKSLKGTDKWEKVTTVESFRTRCTVADLEREKDYFFAVSAENDVGIGEKQKTAKPVKMEKPIFPPSPPTGPLVISDVTKTSFKVTWKAPEKDGGSPVTHYSVEKRETWKTSWTLVERVPGDRLTCDLLLLQEGQDLVGVKAENVAGESKPLESEHAITPMSPYKKPSAPESLTATDVTETAVSLKWKPPTSDGGLPIKSYIVERRDKHWGSWVKAGTTKGTVTTLDVDGLVTGQEYYFRVSAENEEGVGPETEMKELVKPTRETVVPEPPTGPVYFSHLDATSVVLDWRAPRDDGGAPVLNYRIEVSQNLDRGDHC